MRGPSSAGKAEAVEDEDVEEFLISPTQDDHAWTDQAGEGETEEEGYLSNTSAPSMQFGHVDLRDADEQAELLDELRKELSLALGGKRKVEAAEQKWRKEAERSVLLGEEMRRLIVEKDKLLDNAAVEAVELRKEIIRLKKENSKLANESVSAQIRAGRAETRLEELKEASRAAIKRNDSLLAQLEACRVSMEGYNRERKEKRAQAKELAAEKQRADEVEKTVCVLKGELKELSRRLAASESTQANLEHDLERAAVREDQFQEAVVAHCTLANELREKVRKLEQEAAGQRAGACSDEAQRLLRDHAVVLAQFGVQREDQLEHVLRVLLNQATEYLEDKRLVKVHKDTIFKLEADFELAKGRCKNLEQQLAMTKEALALCQEELACIQTDSPSPRGSASAIGFLGGASDYNSQDTRVLDDTIQRLEHDLARAKQGPRDGPLQLESERTRAQEEDAMRLESQLQCVRSDVERLESEVAEARRAQAEAYRERDRAEVRKDRAEASLTKEKVRLDEAKRRIAELETRGLMHARMNSIDRAQEPVVELLLGGRRDEDAAEVNKRVAPMLPPRRRRLRGGAWGDECRDSLDSLSSAGVMSSGHTRASTTGSEALSDSED